MAGISSFDAMRDFVRTELREVGYDEDTIATAMIGAAGAIAALVAARDNHAMSVAAEKHAEAACESAEEAFLASGDPATTRTYDAAHSAAMAASEAEFAAYSDLQSLSYALRTAAYFAIDATSDQP